MYRQLDGDYISIQEIDSNGNKTLVAYLTGPDVAVSNNIIIRKIISISTNSMNIEFKSDDLVERKGFSAHIYFIQVPNKECQSWLDLDKETFKSPNFPEIYHFSMKCSWLITVDHDYHITLNFSKLYVRYQIMNKYF